MQKTIKNIISELKKTLDQKNINQYELAKLSGISQPNLSRMLNDDGRSYPTLKTLLKICEAAKIGIVFFDYELKKQ